MIKYSRLAPPLPRLVHYGIPVLNQREGIRGPNDRDRPDNFHFLITHIAPKPSFIESKHHRMTRKWIYLVDPTRQRDAEAWTPVTFGEAAGA